MFEQKNALPGSELHFPIDNRHVSLVRVRTMRMCDGMSSLPSELCVK